LPNKKRSSENREIYSIIEYDRKHKNDRNAFTMKFSTHN
jgi:hypothetical protein